MCFLTRGVYSGAEMATVKEMYYLFEKSAGVWSVDQLPSPACRQPGTEAATELDDLVFQMRC